MPAGRVSGQSSKVMADQGLLKSQLGILSKADMLAVEDASISIWRYHGSTC